MPGRNRPVPRLALRETQLSAIYFNERQGSQNGANMRFSEMSPKQKREYNRLAKQRQRAKARADRTLRIIPNARDYAMPESQKQELSQRCETIKNTVAAELGVEKLSYQEEYIVDAVASVLFGLENNITQIVQNPSGMLVGGWFPDSAASQAIEHVHGFPHLFGSATFVDLYRKFLHAVAEWSKKNEQYSISEFIQEIKAEIAGEYVCHGRHDVLGSDGRRLDAI